MRYLILFLLSAGIGMGLMGVQPSAANEPQTPFAHSLSKIVATGETPIVVELYTSQGCSSCPPADELMVEIAPTPGLIALSFHVDYWDYIGWKDPFGMPEATTRQRAYQRHFRTRYVYTPQMIVDGDYQFTGSHRNKLKICATYATQKQKLKLQATHGRQVVIPASQQSEPAKIWLIGFDRFHQTDVSRGENTGRRIHNAHSVRYIKDLSTYTGQEQVLDIPKLPYHGSVVLVQKHGYGPIIGALMLD